MKTLALITVFSLVGCAASPTGVVPKQEGLNTLTREGESPSVTMADLRAAALVEGNQYCETKQMAMKVVELQEIPRGVFGSGHRVEVLFRCQELRK